MKFKKASVLVLLGIFILWAIAVLLTLPERISCYSRWSDSGHESRYGIWSDCQVSVNGHWLPEKSVRNIQ